MTDFPESIHAHFSRQTQPGAEPGSLVVSAEEPKPVIHAFAYSADKLVEVEVDSAGEVRKLIDQSTVTWVNVDGFGDLQIIRELGDAFDLHDLALEDVINVHQRAKVEEYDDHCFVVMRMASEAGGLETEQLGMFIGENYVLTFQDGPPGDCLDPVRRRFRKGIGRIRELGADYLAYALIDAVIDHYFPLVESISQRMDALEDRVTAETGGNPIPAVHKLRQELQILRRTLEPHREAIHKLMRNNDDFVTPPVRVFLRDCFDHTGQLLDVVGHNRDRCSDLRDFHFTSVGNRTNEVMQTLTIIATIFIPMSFVAGLYGMNFEHMPELHWSSGYQFALGLMATIAISMLGWFWKRGWFRSK